jgi:hypothetical protein
VSRMGKVVAAVLAGVMALGPPAAAVAAFLDPITRHPVVAIFVVIGYEFLVVLVALLGKTISGPIDRRTQQLGDRDDH